MVVSLVRGAIGQNFPLRCAQALVPCTSSSPPSWHKTSASDSFSSVPRTKPQITQTTTSNLQEQFLPLPIVGQGAILDQLFLKLDEFGLLSTS